jgi:sugar-specific transcriptional regulator TrmB
MLSENEEIQLLTQIGFTANQAKIYLSLLKRGEMDGKSISKSAKVPRPEVYRTIDELQKKGLVEREISTPYKFKATPLDYGLQVLQLQQVQKCREMQEKTKEALRKFQSLFLKPSEEQEYRLMMVEGKARLVQIMKLEHNNVQQTTAILTTLQRWLQILDFCLQEYTEALDRKVKYRVVIEKPAEKIMFPENIKALLAKSNFELRLSKEHLRINAAVFDENEATINFFEGKSLMESPIIWTNHPGFIQMCQDHFDKVWKSAEKYKI